MTPGENEITAPTTPQSADVVELLEQAPISAEAYSDQSAANIEAMLSGLQEVNPPTTPEGAEGENTPTTPTLKLDPATIGLIEYEGEQLTQEQFVERMSKGKDATKKWQQAAQLKAEAESVKEQAEQWNQLETVFTQFGPEKAIAMLAQSYNVANPATSQPQVDLEDFSDNEKMLYAQLQQAEAKMKQFEANNKQLTSVLNSLDEYVKEQRVGETASSIAAAIQAEYGVQVTPSELRASVERTGINDLTASWLKENASALVKKTFVKGHNQAAAPKPNSPTGQSNSFSTKGLRASEIHANISKGLVPSD